MWNDPVKNTPSIVQTNFGPYGEDIPADGESYCAPTSVVMGLYWLASNGFYMLAPLFTSQDDPDAVSLERTVAGLLGTSATGGTGPMTGVADYLSACGIGPDQYSYASCGNPDLTWLATQLAPNVAADPDTIVLAVFSVGWFVHASKTCACDATLCNVGGHALAPLTVDLSGGTVTLNNAYPASFLDVPNTPASNPQTVKLRRLPSGWTLENLSLPSQDYSEVVTADLGHPKQTYAVLWGAEAWAISAEALNAPPATWSIDGAKVINTNGGFLFVRAPLSGAGGLEKRGQGTLMLTNTNALKGRNLVQNGTLGSTQMSGAPFGTGSVALSNGGTLELSPNFSGAVEAAVAPGASATLELGGGGGTLLLFGPNGYAVTIGGNDDGATPNLDRTAGGTLVILPGAGTAELGASQKVLVAGSDGNLPAVSNGIVAPYIVGEEPDTAGSGKFLTYDASAGFQPASTVLSSSVAIGEVTGSDVYQVVDDQAIASGGTAQVAALEMNGGTVGGSDTSLLVGSQASGDVAGVIMNSGSISAAELSFGAAEGLIYSAAGGGSTIASDIAASAGLTFFGPGTVSLTASPSDLAGSITLNGGTVIAAGDQATGTGDVSVRSNATLEITGSVAGAIDVGQSGTLSLNGGTAQGAVTIEAIGSDTSAPGGIIQGGGTIAGTASIGGVIQSGPQPGILEFQGDVAIAGGSLIYWRLQKLVDDTNSKAGVDWNALRFDSANTSIGSDTSYPVYLADFSALGGDPDDGDPFWAKPRKWTFITLPTAAICYWNGENFQYASGSFDFDWVGETIFLTWTPAAAPRSLADRLAAQSQARRDARQRRQPRQAAS